MGRFGSGEGFNLRVNAPYRMPIIQRRQVLGFFGAGIWFFGVVSMSVARGRRGCRGIAVCDGTGDEHW